MDCLTLALAAQLGGKPPKQAGWNLGFRCSLKRCGGAALASARAALNFELGTGLEIKV